LHLCRTNEIDLAAFPVRAITDQYLAHLESMEFRDLEAAGAYLVIAATLIYLKSKLLVPPDEMQDEQLDEDGLSLRLELEARLREYARVKARGEWLASREAEQSLIWGRPGSTLPPPEEVPLEDLSVHLPRADTAKADRGPGAAATAPSRAEPAVGARADDDDSLGSPRHLVAALLVAHGG